MTVGTLEWATSWAEHGGPVLAHGDVEVPSDMRISLSVQPIASLEPAGGGVFVHKSDEVVDLAFLRDLPPDGIENLQLETVVTPGSWTALTHLAPGLRWLYVIRAEFPDDALSAIAELTGLEYLQCYGNRFTDAGVQCLASLRSIESLYLEEETLTANAFGFVTDLPRLRRLGLQDVRITDSELRSLQQQLPGVLVSK